MRERRRENRQIDHKKSECSMVEIQGGKEGKGEPRNIPIGTKNRTSRRRSTYYTAYN